MDEDGYLITRRIAEMNSEKDNLKIAVENCVSRQIFLKIYLQGIKKYSGFLRIFSKDEIDYINDYDRLITGDLADILNKLSADFERYASIEEAKKDLKNLQKNQEIIGCFLLNILKKMKEQMSIRERIDFFFLNLKLAFFRKDEGGGKDAEFCHGRRN